MNELPLLFDAPSTSRVPPARANRGQPLWMAPAWAIGRLRPQLRAVVSADAMALSKYPRLVVEAGPLLAVLALAVGFALIHYTHAFSFLWFGWAQASMADVYLEIPVFLLLVILLGGWSPSLGVLFVLLYSVLDVAVAATQYQEHSPLPGALAGRLITLWLLWLLVVEIPMFGRALAVSWRPVARSRAVVAALAAGSTGALTWCWTQAAPILVRPMYIWSDLKNVTIPAVKPVQTSGLVFAIFAAVVAGACVLSRGPDAIIRPEPAESPSNLPPGLRAGARGAAMAGLLTITLGGLISSPWEAVVLFVGLAASRPLAQFVANRTVLGAAVRMMPLVVRYAVGAAGALAVAQVVVGPLWQANLRATFVDPTPRFFSIIFGIVVAFFVVALATTPANTERHASGVASMLATITVIAGALVVLLAAAPVVALADNCSGLSDCWGSAIAGGIAGGATPLLMAAATRPRRPPEDEAAKDKQYRDAEIKELNRKKDWWQKNGETPKETADRCRYLDQRIKYYSKPTPPPSSDGKPISGRAIGSSGAGTRT